MSACFTKQYIAVMEKIGIVVLAGTNGAGNLGRVVNALETAKEFYAAGDDVEIIFDGAGTEWVSELADTDHRYHGLYSEIKETITGACRFCSEAYGVLSAVEDEEIDLLDEHDGHPSLRRLVAAGYTVITF